MKMAPKEFKEFQALCEAKGVSYDTEEEWREAARRLLDVFDLLFKGAVEHHQWDQRLKLEPKGFAITSQGRSCCLCHTSVIGEVWYDKWGMKCLTCQNALNKRIVPGYVFRDKDNQRHVTASQLQWRYNVHPQTIRKLIRQKKLKPRVIPNGITLFLRTDNPDLPEVIQGSTEV